MSPPSHHLSVLVERLLDLPAERWSEELRQANASPEMAAEVLAILNAVSGRLQGWLPSGTTAAHVLQATPFRNADRTPPSIPGYEILEELGRGGMGVVFKARQVSLNRIVALKTIRAGSDASPADQARFQTEAEAIARLQHPHIVTLYEFGRHDNLLYFTLECVPGGSLARKLAVSPLEARAAARLVEQVASAIQFAHEQGILHRDLKPGNVLLTADGSPRVSDFGLAKRLAGAADEAAPEPTTVGTLLGTPGYLAPELADIGGSPPAASPATDIYGLGAVLYECLTGRPPFRGVTLLDTLEQVRTDEPVPPRRLNRAAPADLETICLKCLHKHPQRRYASARALGEDLRRFQENRPILARPVGRVERVVRWCRRNPAPATLAVVLAVTLVVLPLGGLWLWRTHEIAGLHARAADSERYASLLNSVRAGISQGRPGWTWNGLNQLTEAARLPTPIRDLGELRTEAATCLAGVDFRKKTVLYHGYPDCTLAFGPDGKVLAAAALRGGDADLPRTVLLLEIETGKLLDTLTYPADREWSRTTGLYDGTRSLAFSRDGRRMAAGTRSGWIHCWNLDEPRRAPLTWRGPAGVDVDQLVFSSDGTSLLSLSRKKTSLVRWDLTDGGRERARFETGSGLLTGLVLHPTARLLATRQCPRTVLLDPDRLSTIPFPCTADVWPYCFSPDGRFLAGQEKDRIVLLELASGRVIRTLQDPELDRAHQEPLGHLAWSPDGALLLSASHVDEDRTVKIWEAATGRLLATDALGTRRFHAVAWHPEGRSFAASLDDELIALYEVAWLREQTFLAQHATPLQAFRFSPDGASLACKSVGQVSCWSAASGRLRHRHAHPPQEQDSSLAFHPDGRTVAYASGETRIDFWTGEPGAPAPVPVDGPVRSLAFAPNGERLWAIVDGDRVLTWNWPTGQPLTDWKNDVTTGLGALYCLAVGRRWALVGGRDGGVRVFDAANAQLVTTCELAATQIRSVVLAGDETAAAVGTQDGVVRLVRVPSGEPVLELEGHRLSVQGVAFSPDGSLLATGSRDRSIRLYRRGTAGGDAFELLELQCAGAIRDLAFHPDGRRLVFLLQNESALRVWHLDRLHRRLAAMGLADDWPAPRAAPVY